MSFNLKENIMVIRDWYLVAPGYRKLVTQTQVVKYRA